MKVMASGTAVERHGNSGSDLVARLTAAMKNARLDCECRPRLDEALDRFAALKRRRAMLGNLSNARGQRRKIEAILLFLQDLDDLKTTERDNGVYEDFAFLFEDIASAAREGADAIRRLMESSAA